MENTAWLIVSTGQEPVPVPADGKLVIDAASVLLARVGDPVFVVGGRYRAGRIEYWINAGKFRLSDAGKIGDTIFFNVEDAERRIAEWKERKYDPTYDK